MNNSRESVSELINQWISRGWQKGYASAMDDLLSDNFIDYDPSGRSSDKAGFKEGIGKLYTAFPDFYASVEEILWDEKANKVAVRWIGTGTHKGDYLGVNATGKVVKFKGIEIVEIKNNLITKRWGEWDGIDILEQINS